MPQPNSPQPLPPNGEIFEPDSHLTRRQFLRVVGAVAATFAAKELTDSSVTWALLAPDPEDIPSAVPPELHHTIIRYENEHYQADAAVFVGDTIDAYKSEGGRPFYLRPAYYFSQGDMIWGAARSLDNPDNVREVLSQPGTHYQKNIQFSRLPYLRAADLMDIDPGSTARLRAERALQAIDGNPHTSAIPGQDGITKRDMVIADTYLKVFEEARGHIDALRKKQAGRPVSTGELFKYYLHKNRGDITTSLLDTTVFLKMASRVDLKKLAAIGDGTYDSSIDRPYGAAGPNEFADYIKKGSYEGARFIANRFYDEFAETLPLDELLRVVPATSSLNDFEYDASFTRTRDASYKDYDPVNRAGLAYHAWNMIFLAASADPTAVKKLAAAYYAYEPAQKDQGRIKLAADLRIAEQSADIREVFEQYA